MEPRSEAKVASFVRVADDCASFGSWLRSTSAALAAATAGSAVLEDWERARMDWERFELNAVRAHWLMARGALRDAEAMVVAHGLTMDGMAERRINVEMLRAADVERASPSGLAIFVYSIVPRLSRKHRGLTGRDWTSLLALE